MTLNNKALALAAAAALMTTGLAGCGSDDEKDKSNGVADKSAADIETAAKDAMADAKSLTLKGEFVTDGSDLSMELSTNTDGECVGTIGAEKAEANFIRTKDGLYLKGDEAFWKLTAPEQADAITTMLGTKWAKLPAASADQFVSFCDLDELIKDLVDDSGKSKFEKDGEETVDGVKTVKLQEQEGGDETDGLSTIWVATEGKPYVIKFVTEGGAEPGTANFSNYDDEVKAEAPDSADVVDLSKS